MVYGRRRNKKIVVYTDGYFIPVKHENCIIYRDNNNNKLHKKNCSSMKEVIHFLDYHELFDYEYGNIPEKYLILIGKKK